MVIYGLPRFARFSYSGRGSAHSCHMGMVVLLPPSLPPSLPPYLPTYLVAPLAPVTRHILRLTILSVRVATDTSQSILTGYAL